MAEELVMRKVAAVIIDDWKLNIFNERLTEAKYEYANAGVGPTTGSTILHVRYEEHERPKLQQLLTNIQSECNKIRARKMH